VVRILTTDRQFNFLLSRHRDTSVVQTNVEVTSRRTKAGCRGKAKKPVHRRILIRTSSEAPNVTGHHVGQEDCAVELIC
jgi:hypothetical protein